MEVAEKNTPLANLARDITMCLQTRTIAAVRGPAGVGKSEMVRKIAEDLGVQLFTLIGSLADPTDINGFPVVAQGRRVPSAYPPGSDRDYPVLEFAPRDWMVKANEGAIIFLDELTSAPPPVKAAMLHLLTQWEAGDFKLDPDRVGFVAAFNDADEAVNGSELGFPMVNRLTHFDFPVSHEAVFEWTDEFPRYWGKPKVVSFQGRILPEEFLLQARAAVAGYIRKEPNQWHHRLWDQAAKGGSKSKKDDNHTQGQAPTTGAVTPRSWDRVCRHVALAKAGGQHPLTALKRIVGEVGEGPAQSFEVYLRDVQLPDPEKILAEPETFRTTGRLDIDFATVMAVTAATRAKLTPERYEAAWKVLNTCADKAKGGQIAYEAGCAGALQLQPFLQIDRSSELTAKMSAAEGNKYVARVLNLAEPYMTIAKKIRGKGK